MAITTTKTGRHAPQQREPIVIRTALKRTAAATAVVGTAFLAVPAAHADTWGHYGHHNGGHYRVHGHHNTVGNHNVGGDHNIVGGGHNIIVIVGNDFTCSAFGIYGVANSACVRS